jgi:small subunit ribosomal protein S18
MPPSPPIPCHRRCPLPRKDTRKETRGTGGAKDKKGARPQRKKVCYFCRDKVVYVDFKDVAMLRRFVSDRGKIRARRVTGTCSQHQRDVAKAVKSAREVALLPYVIR